LEELVPLLFPASGCWGRVQGICAGLRWASSEGSAKGSARKCGSIPERWL